jgi:DNA uptake protein ComE-like DNA-binding protein
MTDKRIINKLDGFLILLLFLLLIFYMYMDEKRGVYTVEKYRPEDLSEKGEMTAFQKITLGIPIDINKESVNGLTAIPGIGKSLARTIRDGRVKRNGYKDINELRTLPGIGEKLFSKIAPYIKV